MHSFSEPAKRPAGFWVGTAFSLPMLLAVAVAYVVAAVFGFAAEFSPFDAWPR